MIGVLGAGSWGTALAIELAKKHSNKNIPVWGHDPQHLAEIRASKENKLYLPGILLPNNLQFIDDLATVIGMIETILIVVPSSVFVEVLMRIKPYLTAQHQLIWATKGLEPTSSKFFHQVVDTVLARKINCAVLSGPSFAKEVAQGLPTAVTIACKEADFGTKLVEYFHSKTFRVYLNADIIGVQLGGVVKNVFAVAAGISDGLKFGANARAALITRGLVEMNRLGKALGAKQETLLGLSGMGDVILSATDNQSRNKRFGIAMAKGKTIDEAKLEIGQAVEAVSNATAIYKLAQEFAVSTPIIEQIHLLLTQQTTPRAAVEALLSRQQGYEYN